MPMMNNNDEQNFQNNKVILCLAVTKIIKLQNKCVMKEFCSKKSRNPSKAYSTHNKDDQELLYDMLCKKRVNQVSNSSSTSCPMKDIESEFGK